MTGGKSSITPLCDTMIISGALEFSWWCFCLIQKQAKDLLVLDITIFFLNKADVGNWTSSKCRTHRKCQPCMDTSKNIVVSKGTWFWTVVHCSSY